MPNGGIPVYLVIDSVGFASAFGKGTASHKITDVWVSVNGKSIGTFQIPAKIPVLQSGDIRVELGAGIKDNGIANTRVEYPFYAVDTFSISNAQSGNTYRHVPVFQYMPAAKFALIEDFDATNSFSGLTLNTDRTDSNVFEGTRSAKIYLGPNDTAAFAYHAAGFPITGAGQNVYVELNYKCDGYFECGMLSYKNGSVSDLYKITFNPKSTWNKTYLNFGNEVGATAGDSYRLYFKVSKVADGSTVTVLLDNIKVVQF